MTLQKNLGWIFLVQRLSIFPSRDGIVTRDNVKVGFGRGLAFATGLPGPLFSQRLQQEFLQTFRSRVCWFRPRCEPKKLFGLEIKIRSWSQHRNVLVGRSSSFHESTLSSGMMFSCRQVFPHQLSFVNILQEQQWRRVWSISGVQEVLRISARIHATSFLCTSASVWELGLSVGNYVGITIDSKLSLRRVSLHLASLWLIPNTDPLLLRRHWELIDWKKCAKNQFNGAITTFEVNGSGFHSFPYAPTKRW